jgi:hypothetical protein
MTQNLTCFTPPVTIRPSCGLYSTLKMRFASPLELASIRLLCQSYTATEWSSSNPTELRNRPVPSNESETTPLLWNPFSSASSSHVVEDQTQMLGSRPAWPVATISPSGCIAMQSTSSVCAVKNCCACSVAS